MSHWQGKNIMLKKSIIVTLYSEKTMRIIKLLSISTIMFATGSLAQDIQLDEVVVEANAPSSLTVQSNIEAENTLKKAAGGVGLVTADELQDRYALTLQDSLRYEAGVFAQKRYGEELRLSIRGSGLSRGFHLRGINLLQDGIPFNLADGSGDFQEADMLAMQRIELFKGANALQYGTATLGGAINMVSKTGVSDEGDVLRLEAGSFNTYRFNVASGRNYGDADAFISLTGLSTGGYRVHDDQENLKLNANYGKKISETIETRFYLNGNIINQDLPGTVSRTQALNNPKRANPLVIRDDQQRDIRSIRFSNKTTFKVGDDDKINVGAFVNDKDLFHPITGIVIDQQSLDYGAFANGEGEYSLSGYRNAYRLGVNAQIGSTDAKVFRNVRGSRGVLTGDAEQSAENIALYGENYFYVIDELALIGGLQANFAKRDFTDFRNPRRSDEEDYLGISPKIGALYEPSQDLQFFTNVSRAYEPPTFTELTQSGTSDFIPVNPQKAWTVEVGSRGVRGIATWDISLYRAWLNDEMLQFTPSVGIPAATFNAGDTIHQGLEAAIGLDLAQDLFAQADLLNWRTAYTYSDFYFVDSAQYGDNVIAGQPKHFAQTELRYDHPNGWHIAPNIEFASSAKVDFANTLETPSYAVLGFGAGYEITPNFSLFFDGRNLLDKNYISTFSTIVNQRANGDVFFPADGRALFGGVRIKL
jgi:iron complex outermembrane receptor protein